MKVIVFAASSSTTSINKRLVTFAVSLLQDVDVEILDLNDYEMPLFSEDREKLFGHHELARQFLAKITESDAIIVSFAEHNGCYSAAYKNLFDWCSRINTKVFQNKPMVMLSTSPGPRGGATVLALATGSAPYFDGDVKASLSIPSFYENFDVENERFSNDELLRQLKVAVESIL